MALFVWKCGLCESTTRRILPSRPTLEACEACGGKLSFVNNMSTQTMEVIDNGLMARKLERPVDIEQKIAERNAEAEKPDDSVI